MKQLLTWCGSQALPEKPSGDVKNANAIMAARAIQQELIDDFANRPELSDWFSREEIAAPPVVKKPNPTNEKNKATLQELEEEVRRYGSPGSHERSEANSCVVSKRRKPHGKASRDQRNLLHRVQHGRTTPQQRRWPTSTLRYWILHKLRYYRNYNCLRHKPKNSRPPQPSRSHSRLQLLYSRILRSSASLWSLASTFSQTVYIRSSSTATPPSASQIAYWVQRRRDWKSAIGKPRKEPVRTALGLVMC